MYRNLGSACAILLHFALRIKNRNLFRKAFDAESALQVQSGQLSCDPNTSSSCDSRSAFQPGDRGVDSSLSGFPHTGLG